MDDEIDDKLLFPMSHIHQILKEITGMRVSKEASERTRKIVSSHLINLIKSHSTSENLRSYWLKTFGIDIFEEPQLEIGSRALIRRLCKESNTRYTIELDEVVVKSAVLLTQTVSLMAQDRARRNDRKTIQLEDIITELDFTYLITFKKQADLEEDLENTIIKITPSPVSGQQSYLMPTFRSSGVPNIVSLDAKNDRVGHQTFYRTPEYDQILHGKKWLVFGRRGSGKTAIVDAMINEIRAKAMAGMNDDVIRLTDYHDLQSLYTYDGKEIDATQSAIAQKYFLIPWKILIMKTIAEKYHSTLSRRTKKELDEYGFIDKESRFDTVKKITEKIFNRANIKLIGGLVSINFGNSDVSKNIDLTNSRIDDLFDLIIDDLRRKEFSITILVDELDTLEKNTYGESLSALGQIAAHIYSSPKFMQDPQDMFNPRHVLRLIVFMREDVKPILSGLWVAHNNDKFVDLKWDEPSLRALVMSRLAFELQKEPEQAFSLMFPSQYQVGRLKNTPLWDYIMQNSFARPRDVIRFIQRLEESGSVQPVSGKNLDKDYQDLFDRVTKIYSEEIRDDLIAEMSDLFKFKVSKMAMNADIDDECLNDVLASLKGLKIYNKWNEVSEKLTTYNAFIRKYDIDPSLIVEELVRLNVFGVDFGRGRRIEGFPYANSNISHKISNYRNEKLNVHWSLRNALGIKMQ